MKKFIKNFIKFFFLSIFSLTYFGKSLTKENLITFQKIKKKKLKKFYWYLSEND